MSTSAARGTATEAQLLALPDQGRGFELLDGQIVEKHGGFRHSRAQGRLAQRLAPYDRGGGPSGHPFGWWFLVEQLVRFESGRALRPDLAGWRRDRLPVPPTHDEAVIQVRPDWIAEIVSPTNAGNDLVREG